jgi:hypothetical protein
MEVFIKITTAGVNSGPFFNLFQNNDGFAVPFATDVPLATLQVGDVYTINDASTQVKVVDVGGVCTTELIINIVICTTTTTTTIEPVATTTTTTTEEEPVGTTTTTTTICTEPIDLTGYSNISAQDACTSGLPPDATYYADGSQFVSISVIYIGDCSTLAPAGFYMDVGGHWREWNGSVFIDSGIISC